MKRREAKKLIGFNLNIQYAKNGYRYNQTGIIKEVYKNSLGFKLHGMNSLITIEFKTIIEYKKLKDGK